MNINSNLKQELLVSAKRELKNPFANIEGKKPEVKLPELVDKVTLTAVDSSSFDKYVEEMENGKQGVADKFVKTLENFIGDFVKGISAVTETEETKEVEETNNIEQANNKVGGSTHEKIAFAENQYQSVNAKIEELIPKEDELWSKLIEANKLGDKSLQDSLNSQIETIAKELDKLQLEREQINLNLISLKHPELSDIAKELSNLMQEQYDFNNEFGAMQKAQHQSGNFNWEEYYKGEDKKHELQSKIIEVSNELQIKQTNLEMANDLKGLNNQEQKEKAIEIQNKIKENIKKQGDSQKLLENLVYEYNAANRKENAQEIQANIEPQISKLNSEFMQINQELGGLYEQYYAILDGKDVSTQGSETTSSLNNNTQTTTSSTSTTSTTKLGLNEFELESEKKPLEKKDDSKINFFQKHIISSSDSSKNKTVEPKIDRNISRIIDNLGSSKPELEDVIDAFDNAGKRADFNSINKVAKQLDVHFGSSAIRKALKNA